MAKFLWFAIQLVLILFTAYYVVHIGTVLEWYVKTPDAGMVLFALHDLAWAGFGALLVVASYISELGDKVTSLKYVQK